MDRERAIRLYALALRLIPDRDVAAELFMQSSGEADLRARAERWLALQGLEAPVRVDPLPELDAAEQEYALHLARRGRVRRRTRRVFGAALTLLLAAGAIAGVQWWQESQPVGLAADPTYAAEPLAGAELSEGLSLAVYRAEAVPGAVSVWWELRGRGADRAVQQLESDLALVTRAQRLRPVEWEQTPHRSYRVVGRAVFPHPNAPEEATLEAAGLELSLTITRLPEDPDARTIALHRLLEVEGLPVVVERVRVGRYGTTVSVRFPRNSSRIRWPEVLVEGERLRRYGLWGTEPPVRGSYELVLGPVPEGARELVVSFPLGRWTTEELVIDLPAPEAFEWFRRDEEKVEGSLLLETDDRMPEVSGEFLDADGQRWWVRLTPGERVGGSRRYYLTGTLQLPGRTIRIVRDVGNGTMSVTDARKAAPLRASELKRLRLWIRRPMADPQVRIPLTP